MFTREKLFFNWSGGKDSSLALYRLLQQNEHDVVKLFTSVNSDHDRISMHGVRRSLLEKQAATIGIPLEVLEVPGEISMQQYDELMQEKMIRFKKEGIGYGAFGDIFLEDLRAYREEKLRAIHIKALFPLWKKDTSAIIHEFLSLGFKAITVCVDANLLDESFVGRMVDEEFLSDLPAHADPCGENGEFHTFVFEGPIFRQPISFETGEKVLKKFESAENANWNNAFWYCDLIPT